MVFLMMSIRIFLLSSWLSVTRSCFIIYVWSHVVVFVSHKMPISFNLRSPDKLDAWHSEDPISEAIVGSLSSCVTSTAFLEHFTSHASNVLCSCHRREQVYHLFVLILFLWVLIFICWKQAERLLLLLLLHLLFFFSSLFLLPILFRRRRRCCRPFSCCSPRLISTGHMVLSLTILDR